MAKNLEAENEALRNEIEVLKARVAKLETQLSRVTKELVSESIVEYGIDSLI